MPQGKVTINRIEDVSRADIKASSKQEMARRFADVVLGDEAQAILKQYGYTNPAAQ